MMTKGKFYRCAVTRDGLELNYKKKSSTRLDFKKIEGLSSINFLSNFPKGFGSKSKLSQRHIACKCCGIWLWNFPISWRG